MVSHNFFSVSGKIVFAMAADVLYFPLWWYGAGLIRLIKGLSRFWRDQERVLGFSIWLKNIFVPMYGQRDIGGRVISFVMRLVQIIVRGAVLIFWLLVLLVILILWLALPIILIIMISEQLAAFGAEASAIN